MEQLPAEILIDIFTYLPHQSALAARRVNRYVGDCAASAAFRHISIRDVSYTTRVIRIAKSPHLRPLVKEITISRQSRSRDFYFSLALAHLVLFRNLNKINIRFKDQPSWPMATSRGNNMYRQKPGYEDDVYFILAVVFKYLAGNWSPTWQHDLQKNLKLHYIPDTLAAFQSIPLAEIEQEPIHLRALTIFNVAENNDPRLVSSKEFKRVIESKSIRELKMLVLSDQIRTSMDYHPSENTETDFFEHLPRTWFRPSMAQHLQVLSLFAHDYWGWNPKMDFRTVNPGKDIKSGFPSLRVLALGKYVFSHQWQVDWIASLGSDNGRGGLRELYLDDCPIMWEAIVDGPLSEGDITYTAPDGQEFHISNEKYPVYRYSEYPPRYKEYPYTFDLRWHHVLSQWSASMPSLGVFKMGYGNWEHTTGAALGPRHRRQVIQPNSLHGGAFLDYDCPSPNPSRPRNTLGLSVGLQQKPEQVLQYVAFSCQNRNKPWIGKDDRQYMLSKGLYFQYEQRRKLDSQALSELEQKVEQRKKSPHSGT
ncbi:hypothetical protein F5B20DRAFT_575003 [Whalleya microplaca]|nr:hypothetical protein F5B20DRAFT_575003 [Whalleya microplaca]